MFGDAWGIAVPHKWQPQVMSTISGNDSWGDRDSKEELLVFAHGALKSMLLEVWTMSLLASLQGGRILHPKRSQ